MLVSRLGSVALFSVALAAPVVAQDSASCNCSSRDHNPSEFALRSSGSFAFFQGRPVGALQKNIGFGYGGSAAYLFRLDRQGIWSLRADLGFGGYGEESKRVPLSPTIGGRIQVNVRTTNYVVPMSIGPQLTWPSGVIRPYVNAGVGAQAFVTQSSVDGSDDGSYNYSFANTTNQSDWTATWTAGGGLYVPLYQGKTKVMLDLGVQYLTGGHARYLRPGSIVDLPNSQIQINPLESDTHMLLVRVGVKVGL